jgi:hypothetical protein
VTKEKDTTEEDLFLKPKKFRNRKSKPKVDVAEQSHPVHAPYKRDHRNLLLEDDDWEEGYLNEDN